MQLPNVLVPLILLVSASCCGAYLRPLSHWYLNGLAYFPRNEPNPRITRHFRVGPSPSAQKDPLTLNAIKQLCPPYWDRLKCFDVYMSMLVSMSRYKKPDKDGPAKTKPSIRGTLPCNGNKLDCFDRYLMMWLKMVEQMEDRQAGLMFYPKRKSLLGAMHISNKTPCLPGESSLACVERILKNENTTTAKIEEQAKLHTPDTKGKDSDHGLSNFEAFVHRVTCTAHPDSPGCEKKDLSDELNRQRRAKIDICNRFSSTAECFENYLQFYAEVYSSKGQHLGKKHFVGRDTSAALKLLKSSKTEDKTLHQ